MAVRLLGTGGERGGSAAGPRPRWAWASPSESCAAAWGTGRFVVAAAVAWSGSLLSSSIKDRQKCEL